VLSAGSGGVVLPALSGHGKTTLIAWLAARGCGFGSDEMAFIPDGGNRALPFPRPLNVKQRAVALVRKSCDIERHYGAAFSIERLSKARAGLELMRHVVNGARLPGNGFHEVARLAAAAPAYRLRYSDFAQLGPLEQLLSGS